MALPSSLHLCSLPDTEGDNTGTLSGRCAGAEEFLSAALSWSPFVLASVAGAPPSPCRVLSVPWLGVRVRTHIRERVHSPHSLPHLLQWTSSTPVGGLCGRPPTDWARRAGWELRWPWDGWGSWQRPLGWAASFGPCAPCGALHVSSEACAPLPEPRSEGDLQQGGPGVGHLPPRSLSSLLDRPEIQGWTKMRKFIRCDTRAQRDGPRGESVGRACGSLHRGECLQLRDGPGWEPLSLSPGQKGGAEPESMARGHFPYSVSLIC